MRPLTNLRKVATDVSLAVNLAGASNNQHVENQLGSFHILGLDKLRQETAHPRVGNSIIFHQAGLILLAVPDIHVVIVYFI